MSRPSRPGPREWPALALLLLVAGCAAPVGPPAIEAGTPCAACGMGIQDLRFACERRTADGWRAFDAIECLMRDVAGAPAIRDAWLADYDTAALLPADSLWVVHGDFPTPMGGGLAAFGRRSAADSVALATRGRVDRLGAFAAGGT